MLLTIILIFLFFVFLTAKFIAQKPANLPPSPPALPVIGHLHLIKEPIHQTLKKFSEKYGPILHLQLGAKSVIVISSAAAAEECFTTNDVALADRPQHLAGKILNYNYSTIGFSRYGDYWRTLRRLTTMELLSSTRLSAFSIIWNEEVQLLIKQLAMASEGGKQVKVDLSSKLVELIFNIVLRMIAGKRYYGVDVVDKEAMEFRDIMKEWTEAAGSTLNDFIPVLKWMDFQGVERRMKRVMEKMDRFLEFLIKEHKRMRNQKDRDKNTLIDVMLLQQETQPEFYTNQTIKATILALLIAGTETSAITLEWAMSLLLNHPDKMHKAWTEIEAKSGGKKLLDETELSEINYLNCCISETMRMFPAAPLLLPHESSAECTIGGYTVPQGALLWVNLWTIHRDPKLWEEEERFMPERFESGDISRLGYKFIPFGAGRRACPGGPLAKKVMAVALGSMLQAFKWKRVGEELIDMKERPGLTIPKAQALEAIYEPRFHGRA